MCCNSISPHLDRTCRLHHARPHRKRYFIHGKLLSASIAEVRRNSNTIDENHDSPFLKTSLVIQTCGIAVYSLRNDMEWLLSFFRCMKDASNTGMMSWLDPESFPPPMTMRNCRAALISRPAPHCVSGGIIISASLLVQVVSISDV